MKNTIAISSIESSLNILVQEITKYIEESGQVNVHINQVYVPGYSKEEYIRQSFIFYTLCKAKYFFPSCIQDSLLDSIFEHIKYFYQYEEKLSDLEKKYIEAYVVRGTIFRGEVETLFLKHLNTLNTQLIFSTPILLNLFLATEADSLIYLKKSSLAGQYTDMAKEAVYFSIKSNQRETYKAFQYVDIFYYNDALSLTLKDTALNLVKVKMKSELEHQHLIYTSVIAKMFEGFASCYPEHTDICTALLQLCLERKVTLSPFLVKEYHYSEVSLAEVKGTAYVCLDTYAHIILGLLAIHCKCTKK